MTVETEHTPSTLAMAAGAAMAAHRIIEGKDLADVPKDKCVDLIVSGWLEGAQYMADRVTAMLDKRDAHAARSVENSAIPETAEERIALADLDIMNCHGVAANSGHPPVLAMLIPPHRATTWTPEQALVLAAWLVAMSEPWSSVKFAHVLRKVHNS